MTVSGTTDIGYNFERMLSEIDRRLGQLEQTMTSPEVMTTGAPIVFTDPDTGDLVFVSPEHPDNVTGLTAVPGTYFDEIYADVDWNAPITGQIPASYDVELATKAGLIYTLVSEESTGGTSYRFSGLIPNQTYGVRITPVSNIGLRGNTTAWVVFTTAYDATIPPAPVGLSLYRGASSAVVKFTGLTRAQAADVANGNGLYEIQIDTVNTFSSGNLQTMRSTATIVAFEGVDNPAGYYARVSAIDSSGNQSAWSSITGPVTAGGILDSMVVAGLDAAKITFGSMSGDRITANTLDVASIKSSTISTANITVNGGSLKVGNPPTSGVLINSQGIRGYTGSVATFILDVTGAVTVKGTIDSSTITASNIYTSYFNFGGGTIDGTNGVLFVAAPMSALGTLGYPQRGISWWQPVGTFWNITGFADNAGGSSAGMYIQGFSSGYDSIYMQNGTKGDHRLNYIELAAVNVDCGGTFSAVAKLFKIPHATKAKTFLQHANIEGPENAVYYRGTAALVDGHARVALPDYFAWLARLPDRTALLTPIWSDAGVSGLAVGSIEDDGFDVYATDDTNPTQAFHWEVKALRTDVSRLIVELPDDRSEDDIDRNGILTDYGVHLTEQYEDEVNAIMSGRLEPLV